MEPYGLLDKFRNAEQQWFFSFRLHVAGAIVD